MYDFSFFWSSKFYQKSQNIKKFVSSRDRYDLKSLDCKNEISVCCIESPKTRLKVPIPKLLHRNFGTPTHPIQWWYRGRMPTFYIAPLERAPLQCINSCVKTIFWWSFAKCQIYSASHCLYGHIFAGGRPISHFWLPNSFAKISNPQYLHLRYGLLRLFILTSAGPPQLGQTTIFVMNGAENIPLKTYPCFTV